MLNRLYHCLKAQECNGYGVLPSPNLTQARGDLPIACGFVWTVERLDRF